MKIKVVLFIILKKKQKKIVILKDSEKAFDKIKHPFLLETNKQTKNSPKQSGIQKNFLKKYRALSKPTAEVYLVTKGWNLSSWDQSKKRLSILPTSIQNCTGGSNWYIRQEKEIKDIQIEKEEVKCLNLNTSLAI